MFAHINGWFSGKFSPFVRLVKCEHCKSSKIFWRPCWQADNGGPKRSSRKLKDLAELPILVPTSETKIRWICTVTEHVWVEGRCHLPNHDFCQISPYIQAAIFDHEKHKRSYFPEILRYILPKQRAGLKDAGKDKKKKHNLTYQGWKRVGGSELQNKNSSTFKILKCLII